MTPRGVLFLSVARTAVGLGCALPVPLPGMELIRFSDEESTLEEEQEWSTSEWTAAPTEWLAPSILGAHDQQWPNTSAHAAPGIYAIDLSAGEFDNRSSSPIFQHLDSLISNLVMPASWQAEAVEVPTEDCKIYARSLLRRLYNQYELIPYKTSISKDGGLYAAYRGSPGRNTLRVEIDNELDAIAVVTDGSAILNSGLLEGDDDERAVISALNSIPA